MCGPFEVRSQVIATAARDLPDLDLLRGGKQRAHAGGASLHHRRAADVGKAGHSGHPGQSKKRMLLRHSETKHAVIDRIGRNFAVGEFLAQRLRGKLQRIEIGEGALPAGERRAPIAAVGNSASYAMSVSSPCLFAIKGLLQDAFGRVEMVAHGCGCVRRLACGEAPQQAA